MKHILFTLSIFAMFQIGTAQETWNACNSNVTVIPTPAYDSTFVLSAPSRAALAKGMANWTPSTSGGASYLVYTALLTQSGTDAPVATVLENTTGGTIVWTRDSAGFYFGTCSNCFQALETFIVSPAFLQTNADFPDAMRMLRYDDSTIHISTFANGAFDTGADGVLLRAPIEIRIYN